MGSSLDKFTYDYLLMAIRDCGCKLQFAPKDLIDYKICLAAVTNYGGAINYVPDYIIDYDMCLIAVITTRSAIECIPRKYRTFELLMSIPTLYKYKEYIDQSQTEFIKLKYNI